LVWSWYQCCCSCSWWECSEDNIKCSDSVFLLSTWARQVCLLRVKRIKSIKLCVTGTGV
jgi:hypothetical protein